MTTGCLKTSHTGSELKPPGLSYLISDANCPYDAQQSLLCINGYAVKAEASQFDICSFNPAKIKPTASRTRASCTAVLVAEHHQNIEKELLESFSEKQSGREKEMRQELFGGLSP